MNQPTLVSNSPDITKKIDLEKRETSELIIGLVGAVGSGVSYTAEKIRHILKTNYN